MTLTKAIIAVLLLFATSKSVFASVSYKKVQNQNIVQNDDETGEEGEEEEGEEEESVEE